MDVSDEELISFVKWYGKMHKSRYVSILETCMCGYFHTYTKNAVSLRRRLSDMGIVKIHRDGLFEIII